MINIHEKVNSRKSVAAINYFKKKQDYKNAIKASTLK